MFLGQMTPAAVLAAANDPESRVKKDHVARPTLQRRMALGPAPRRRRAACLKTAARDCRTVMTMGRRESGGQALGAAPKASH